MSKAVMVTLLGVLIAFLPFAGIPSLFKTILFVLFGLAVAVLGLLMRVERLWLLRALRGAHKTDAYAENGPTYATEADR